MARSLLRRGAITAPVLAAQGVIGALVATGSSVGGLAAAGAVALVGAVLAPAVVAAAALPASYGFWRFGPGQLSLSVTDLVLGVAILAALPHVRVTPLLRRMVQLVAVYVGMIVIVVAAEPSARAGFELLHRAFLAGGCIVVGAAIAGMERDRLALRLFVATSLVVAAAAVLDTLGSGFAPAYPFGMHKNAAGTLIATAILVSLVARSRLGLPPSGRIAVDVLLFSGMLACQSRGAVLTLVVVLVLWPLVRRRSADAAAPASGIGNRLVPMLGVVAAVVMTVLSANALFTQDAKDDRFNSLNSRTLTYEAAIDLWQEKPLTGQGLKYWRDPAILSRSAFGEPHNLIVSALAESGVVGLAALVMLVVGSLRIVSRNRHPLGQLAVLALVAHPLGALLGIYWVAGTFSLPWLLAGLAVGATAATRGTPAAVEVTVRP